MSIRAPTVALRMGHCGGGVLGHLPGQSGYAASLGSRPVGERPTGTVSQSRNWDTHQREGQASQLAGGWTFSRQPILTPGQG